MRRPVIFLISCLGCAGGRPDPGPSLTPEQTQELRKAERLFRARSPEWPAARDSLVREPATSEWLVRMMIRYAVESYRVAAPEGEDLLKEMAGLERDTLLERTLREFRVLGAVAVDPAFEDLICARVPDNRVVGSMVMAAIGEPAVGRLLRGAKSGEHRRASIQALAAFAARPEVAAALRELSTDREWEVRGEAVAALAKSPEDQSLAVLASVARRDADSFVRRKAMAALGQRGSPEAVAALVDALEEAVRAENAADARAAQLALKKATGQDFVWDVAKWREWIRASSATATRKSGR